jgi:hypothetical protein
MATLAGSPCSREGCTGYLVSTLDRHPGNARGSWLLICSKCDRRHGYDPSMTRPADR